MTNQEAITILQRMADKLDGSYAQALQCGIMALKALGSIPIERCIGEIHRLRHVDQQMATWFPANYDLVLEEFLELDGIQTTES